MCQSRDYERDGFGKQMAGSYEASVRQEETDKEQVDRRLQPNAKK